MRWGDATPRWPSRVESVLREFIDYKTSMITDEDPLPGLLFYQDLGFSHTLHVLKERRRRCEHPHLRGLDSGGRHSRLLVFGLVVKGWCGAEAAEGEGARVVALLARRDAGRQEAEGFGAAACEERR